MIPNIHIHEQLLFERHQELLLEMEQQRLLKGVRRQRFNVLPRIAERVGMFLIAQGTSLKRFEPSREPTVEDLGYSTVLRPRLLLDNGI